MKTVQILLLTLSFGCVTRGTRELVSLPVVLTPFFEGCRSLDGTSLFEMSRGSGEPIAVLQADWVIDPTSMKFEAMAPSGQTLVTAQVDRRDGRIESSLPHSIAIDAQGMMTVSGFQMPIRLDDVVCAMGFRLSNQLVRHLYEVKTPSPRWRLAGEDDQRDWEIDLDSRRYCARFTSSQLFGLMKRSVVICSDVDGSGSMDLDQRYVVKWKSLDASRTEF